MNGYFIWVQRDRENIRDPHLVGPFLGRDTAIKWIKECSQEHFWKDAQFKIAYVSDWETILEGMVGKGW